MSRALCICLGLAALTLVLAVRAQEGTKNPADTKGKQPPEAGKSVVLDPNGKRIPLDKIKLPPGAVIVLCENAKDAVQLFPSAFIMSVEKYQWMTERIAALEKQLRAERKPPHTCALHGTVRGDVLELRAELYFTTDQPRQVVFLGGKGAQVNQALWRPLGKPGAGRVAALDNAPDGFTLQVETPGEYQLSLKMEVPIGAVVPTDPAARGFEVGLPGAAVTTLVLDLPLPVKELRWNKTIEKRTPAVKQKHWEVTLGKLTQVTVSWKEPVVPPRNEPLVTARGQIMVKVEENQISTTAELTLQDLRGQIKDWQLWLPQGATVKVTPPEGTKFSLVPPSKAELVQIHKLQLEQQTDEPVKVTVTVTAPRGQTRVPIGPFGVVEAFRQEGTIEVRASPAARRGVRLNYLRHRDVEERDLPRDLPATDVVALFRYHGMPTPSRPLPGPDVFVKQHQAPLEIELKQNKGRVETHVEHTLRLRQTEQGLRVLATTRIQAKPLYAPVDFLDVQLRRPPLEPATLAASVSAPTGLAGLPWPALVAAAAPPLPGEWSLGRSSSGAELQYLETGGVKNGRARIKFFDYQPKEFTVELTGTYTLPPGARRARLVLPQPLVDVAHGGKLRVEAGEELELLIREGGLEVVAPERDHYTLEPEQPPEFADLAWRPHRPEFPVHVIADVTLRQGAGHVRQQLEFGPGTRPAAGRPDPRPRQVQLRVPAGARQLRVIGGDLPEAFDPARDRTVTVTLSAAAASKLTLEYDFALPRGTPPPKNGAPAESPPFEVPLLWPEQATRIDTKVRLWCDANMLPNLTDAQVAEVAWRDLGTEVVPGVDRLPRRVLSSPRLGVPLWLRLEVTLPERDAVARRALVQVAVDDEGTEHYRVRFLLTELNTTALRLRLPVPLAGQPQITLGGKKVPWVLTENGSVARVTVEPALYGGPVILEVVYQLPRDHLHNEGVWQTGLHAPEFAGNVQVPQVRWQVSLPGGWVPLVAGEDTGSAPQWEWRGGLLTPQPPQTSAQLEEWLTAPPSEGPPVTPSLVLSRGDLRPVYLYRVPLQLWFVLCSGLLLLLGLGLNSSALSAHTAGLLLTLLGLALVALALFLPAVLPAVLYGCEPGAVVLLVVLLCQWMLQERYRRQVVFMPGFKRLKPGSSLVRSGAVGRTRDASTVDAPASPGSAPGSSANKGS